MYQKCDLPVGAGKFLTAGPLRNRPTASLALDRFAVTTSRRMMRSTTRPSGYVVRSTTCSAAAACSSTPIQTSTAAPAIVRGLYASFDTVEASLDRDAD